MSTCDPVVSSATLVFLRGLRTEREFDAPLLALLRLHRFSDIAFIHGVFEFGKDFVAKVDAEGQKTQYLFQSKLGDIGKSDWVKEVQPQCETCRYTQIAYPSFDPDLPRVIVVVCTGRLRGQAGVLVQQYKEHVERDGSLRFEVWDEEKLVELLTAPSCLGAGFNWTVFGHFLHEAESSTTTPSRATSRRSSPGACCP